MCGIAGFVGYKKVKQNEISLCKNLMKKRGPDYIGEYNSNKINISNYFLHSRLSIIDLSDKANQPFTSGDFTILFNGEIYNYLELKSFLEKKGHKFETLSDTEVLLKSYIEYGENCVDYFNGMWAFVIIDNKKKKFFISRDRFGEKPFFYFYDKKNFIFGSEIKYLAQFKNEKLKINKHKIHQFINYGYKVLHKNSETFYKDVYALEPATNLIIDETLNLKKYKYWKPDLNVENNLEYTDVIKNVDKILGKAINLRLRSDVPLAFCLSGGVDSGYLASVSSKKFNKKINSFSIIDSNPMYNEVENISKIENDLNCNSHKIYINKNLSFIDRLRELIKYHDSPISTMSYYVHSFLSEEINRKGFKVSISGTGADEIFTGYYEHFLLYFSSLNNQKINFENELKSWKENIVPFIRNENLKKFDLYINNPTLKKVTFDIDDEIISILKKNNKDKMLFNDVFFTNDVLKNKMLNELFYEVVPVILKHDDMNSMYYSIENRSPYLDHNLVEFMYRVPTKYLIKNSYQKRILRDTSKNILNEEIRLNRIKYGFNVSLESLISKQEILNFFNNNIEIISEFIDHKKFLEKLKTNEIFLNNSIMKFIFTMINVKLFLEINE